MDYIDLYTKFTLHKNVTIIPVKTNEILQYLIEVDNLYTFFSLKIIKLYKI